jgi:hypothetical protein
MTLDIARLMCLDADCAQSIDVDDRYSFRFLTAEEVRGHGLDPANELSSSFADRMLCGRDLCYAALRDENLVGYAWLALGSIEAEQNRGRSPHSGVAASFGADAAFVYKAFTRLEARGRHLYSACLVRALGDVAARGISKLWVTADWLNRAALAGCRRAGCREMGSIVQVGWPGAMFTLAPRGTAELGIQFGNRVRADLRTPVVEGSVIEDSEVEVDVAGSGALRDGAATAGVAAETACLRPAILRT